MAVFLTILLITFSLARIPPRYCCVPLLCFSVASLQRHLISRHFSLGDIHSKVSSQLSIGFWIHWWSLSRYIISLKVKVLVTQCPTLCDPMDCSPPGSSAHPIFQARTLEWVAIPISRGSSWSRDRTRSPALQADSLPFELPGKCFQNDNNLFLCICYLKVHKEELSHINYLRFSL